MASANDQRGNPDAANRRSTPRSRYDAMCTGSMIRPVAPITTVKYDATYQCDGLTGNASSGSVPNEPPMISIVTIGKTSTKVSVSGSRVISRSSAREQPAGHRPGAARLAGRHGLGRAGRRGDGGGHDATPIGVEVVSGWSSRVSRAVSRSGMSTRRSAGIGRAALDQPGADVGDHLAAAADGDLVALVADAVYAGQPVERLQRLGGDGHVEGRRDRRQPEPDRHLAGVPGDQLGGRALVEHPACAHRDDAVGQRLGLVELVGHQHHRRTGVAELAPRPTRPRGAPRGRGPG